MTFEVIGRADERLDIDAMLASAIYGDRLTGVAAEVAAEAEMRHGKGHGGIRVPFSALVQRATGAGPLVGGANALLDFSMDNRTTDVGGAILGELAAGKLGVRMTQTQEETFKMPIVTAKPTGAILDLDEPIPDQGGSVFSTVDIRPVVAASLLDIENSLDFAKNPNARQLVAMHIVETVAKVMDDAILSGYTTGSGRTWAGLSGIATASGVTLNNASTIQNWRALPDLVRAYVGAADLEGYRWAWHPRVSGVLMSSPVFVGSTSALAPTTGVTSLAGFDAAEIMFPVSAVPDTEVFFGDMSQITTVMFDSGTVELVANPYATDVFARGATRMRIISSFGCGVADASRIVKGTVQL